MHYRIELHMCITNCSRRVYANTQIVLENYTITDKKNLLQTPLLSHISQFSLSILIDSLTCL